MKTKLLSILIVFFTLTSNAQTYMYGTTYQGGANDLGTIYRVDKNGQNFEKVFDFTTATGGKPLAGLTLANGKLYGFTTDLGQTVNPGAQLPLGSFFEFDPLTDTFNVVEYIDEKSEIGNTFNQAPLLANDGMLYMASENQGLGEFDGILSKYDPINSSFTVLDTFVFDFGQPKGQLMQASNNHIYIITANGATNGFGALVRWNTSTNQLEKLHTSSGANSNDTGEYDNAQNQLLEGSDGLLYGLSLQGGDYPSEATPNGLGVFFKIGIDGSNYTVIKEFISGLSDEGFSPYGGLIEKNGIIYGSTSEEQIENVNNGTIFSFTLSNSAFQFIHTLDLKGANPRGTFVESTNGRLYLTCEGGNLNLGSIIELNTTNGDVTTRHEFSTSDGIKPYYNKLCLVDFTALSIDENPYLDKIVKIYPNPVKENINVEIEGVDKVESIKILDLRGSEIFSDYAKTKKSTINTSFLSSGIYLLQVKTNNGSLTRKIVIE